MFLGQYQHTVDQKGRTSIPKKFRNEMNSGGIITRGLDGCLFLYTKTEWNSLSSRLEKLPVTAADARNFSRYLFSGASEISFDKLGRILIPDYLRKEASLEKEIVIVGVLNRIEIWSKVNWEKMSGEISRKSGSVAEKLSETGI